MTAFVGLAILARLLTPQDFGLYSMGMAVVSFLQLAQSAGLRSGLIFFGNRDGVEPVFNTAFILAAGLGAVLSMLVLLLAPAVAAYYGEAGVEPILQLLAASFLIGGIGLVPDAILRHQLEFGRRFWPEVGGPLVRYGVGIALALQGFGAWSLIGGQLAGSVATVALSLALSGFWPRFAFRRATAGKLLGYSSRMSGVELLAAVIFNIDYLLVGRFQGSGPLGIYTLAFKLPEATIIALATVASYLLLPTYVQLSGERAKLREAFLSALRYLALTLFPAGFGLAVLAPVLVPLFFGHQWVEAVPLVQRMAVSACIYGLLFSAGPVFQAVGKPGLLLIAESSWALVLVPALYLAAQVDILTVATVQIPAIMVFAVVKLVLLSRLLDLRWSALTRSVLPSALAAVVMALVLRLVLQIDLGNRLDLLAIAGLVAGGLAYVAAIRVLEPEIVAQARTLLRALLLPGTPKSRPGEAYE